MVSPKTFLLRLTDLNFKTISPVKSMEGVKHWLLIILLLVMLNSPDDNKKVNGKSFVLVLLLNSRFFPFKNNSLIITFLALE